MTTITTSPVIPQADFAAPKTEQVQVAAATTRAEFINKAIAEAHQEAKVFQGLPEAANAKVQAEVKLEAKEDQVNASRLAELARRSRKQRVEAEAYKAERQAFETESAKVRPLLGLLNQLESNPEDSEVAFKLIESLGALRGKAAPDFLDEIADRILQTQVEAKEPDIKELVDQRLKEIEDAKSSAFIEEQFSKQKASIEETLKANSDKYELSIDEPDLIEQVFNAQLELFYADGVLHPIEELLNEVEKSLEQRILKYSKFQKQPVSGKFETSSKTAYKAPQETYRGEVPTLTRHQSQGSFLSDTPKVETRKEMLARLVQKARSM